jgi:hypothetical protein
MIRFEMVVSMHIFSFHMKTPHRGTIQHVTPRFYRNLNPLFLTFQTSHNHMSTSRSQIIFTVVSCIVLCCAVQIMFMWRFVDFIGLGSQKMLSFECPLTSSSIWWEGWDNFRNITFYTISTKLTAEEHFIPCTHHRNFRTYQGWGCFQNND